ncbi:MAG: hypothetical protein LJF04_08045 [Gemmatimonadetes bacterium]|nr:hypothetical protein [Gemmatimonadota bacterium]
MIRRLFVSAAFGAVVSLSSTPARAQEAWSGLSPDMQIRLALQAAPPELRDGATVQGYDSTGAFVTLRQGATDLICMAPNPTSQQLEVSCHQAGLEAFFARGRDLRAAGTPDNQVVQTRWKEFTAGKLAIPSGTVNSIVTGTGFDPGTGTIRDRYERWTIYTPGATPESTGLSTQPSAGGPWLMFPGTPGAHIMITPPRGGTR